MASRRRLDAELVRRSLATSRAEAQRLVSEGRVTVGGAPATKAATLVTPTDALVVSDADAGRYASRAGHKLAGALDTLAVDVDRRQCLDAGAAHGGFTDVLLRRGAARVVAVDVGYGQLEWRLRTDPRVVVLDRTNVRTLNAGSFPPPAPDLVVADLSFISLRLVLAALRDAARPDADFVLLVKPQFEVGRESVGKGGVVRDPRLWESAVAGVAAAADGHGLGAVGMCPSPLPGPSGNVEFFVHLREGAGGDAATLAAAAAADGRQLIDRVAR